MIRSASIAIISLMLGNTLFCQNFKKDQETYLEAEYFLMYGDYADALPYYIKLSKEYPENYNLVYRIGLCYLNIPGQKNLATEYLDKASRHSSASYKEGSLKQTTAPYDVFYNLGEACRINYQFEKAKEAFSKYKETLLKDDTGNILFIDQEIAVCDNAVTMMNNPVSFTEVNLGEPINDAYSNFNPVVSSDGNTMVYMTALKFYDAVFFTRKEKGKWTSPVNITPELQSDGDLYISYLSPDGKKLFLSRDDDNNSDIYSSTFDGVRWSVAEKLDKTINTKGWESHAVLSDDGKSMIFSSDRPGGFGALDLYISYLNSDGSWGTPVNLGPEINTPFNEDRAFLTDNGRLLFFASQGHSNMGGFDIFRSQKDQNGKWGKPQNLGYPLNTPDDDLFFMPVDNGKSGYMSLYQEGKGFGKEDIYQITFK